MTRMDFKKAVPETPNAFTEAMRKAMNNMQEVQIRRKKPKTLLVAALVGAILLVGTAFALTNGFGVFDFWNRYERNEILPEALELVEPLNDVASVETQRVRYRAVDAAATDGKISATVVAELKEPEKFILMDDAWGDPLAVPEGFDKSYEQLAKESGRTLVCVDPMITINGEFSGGSVSDKLEGGKLYLYAETDYDGKTDESIQVTYELTDYEVYGSTASTYSVQVHTDEGEKTSISFEIEPKSEVLESRTFDVNWSMGEITVERVTVERTPFYTRVSVIYSAPDEPSNDAVLASFFFTSDQAGEKPFEVDNERAMTTHIEGNRFKTIRYWQTMTTLPETIYLRPFFWDDYKWGEVMSLTTKDGRTDK